MIIDMIFRFFSYTRVYLKTHDVTGSEGFLRCARHFFAGILTYFKEKWRGAPLKGPLSGCVESFQIHPSSSLILKFYFWIEMRKLNSSVVSRKMPRNTFLCEISFLRPSRKNLVQVLNRWNTDIQKALNSKRGQLNFSHIQPWPMFWRVMDLKLLRNTVCLLRWKRFVERGGSMCIQVIHHQNDFIRIGVGFISVQSSSRRGLRYSPCPQ